MTLTVIRSVSIAARALILALFVIFNTGCPPLGCPPSEPTTPPGPVAADVAFDCSVSLQPDATFTDSFVGALVVDSSDVVSNPQLTVDGTPIPINSNLDDVVSGIIRDALIRKGVFDPQTQYLIFFQTSSAITILPTTRFSISYTLKRADGSLVINGRTGGGGTSRSLVRGIIPLDDFFAFQVAVNPTVITVPTLTQWGVIISVLLMLMIGTIFIAGRTRAAAIVGTGLVIPVAPRVFASVLAVALVTLSIGFAVVTFLMGTVSSADALGTAVSTLIVAYILHLLIVTTEYYQHQKRVD